MSDRKVLPSTPTLAMYVAFRDNHRVRSTVNGYDQFKLDYLAMFNIAPDLKLEPDQDEKPK